MGNDEKKGEGLSPTSILDFFSFWVPRISVEILASLRCFSIITTCKIATEPLSISL